MQFRFSLCLVLCLFLVVTSTAAKSEDTLGAPNSKEFPNCRHEKTKGALPAGAPLSDFSQGDNITPKQAYEGARKCLSNGYEADAIEHFERAVGALRKAKDHLDKKLAKKIVSEYGKLLRAHNDNKKADGLEKEFTSDLGNLKIQDRTSSLFVRGSCIPVDEKMEGRAIVGPSFRKGKSLILAPSIKKPAS